MAFLVDLQRITEIATALGRTADAAAYASYRAWVISGFNSAWRVGDGSSYGNANGDGRQTANAAALALGAAAAAGNAPAVAAALVNDIVSAHGGFASVGIIGMRWLHTALVEAGSGKLAVDLMLQTDYPSYGWEFNHPDEPATTLWELLDGPTEGPGSACRARRLVKREGGIGAPARRPNCRRGRDAPRACAGRTFLCRRRCRPLQRLQSTLAPRLALPLTPTPPAARPLTRPTLPPPPSTTTTLPPPCSELPRAPHVQLARRVAL